VTALPVRLRDNRIHVGDRFSLSLQRTLRLPDDGRTYPLPPGLGRFVVHPVSEFSDRVPDAWRAAGGFFVAVYQREALWIGFDAAPWKPNAVKIGIGHVNAVSDAAWSEELHADPQDYLVCPPQLWIDGINAGDGYVRQFVATTLGRGHTVEAQVSGVESTGGIQILVYEPKPNRFPEAPPPPDNAQAHPQHGFRPPQTGAMGIAVGGRMTQKIYADPHGVDVWNQDEVGIVHVHLVNTEEYGTITGRPAPPTPIDAHAYTAHGLPWFALYDEALTDIAPAARLARVRSISELAGPDAGPDRTGDEPLDVDPRQIRRIDGREPESR
jgi:hypothetical protein